MAYALGAVRILRFGALVQQANAIESLSNVDVLCLDKTGTLTTNRLRVTGLWSVDSDEAALRHTLGTIVASATAPNKTSAAIAAAVPAPPQTPVAETPFSSARKWSAVALAGQPDAARPGAPLRGVFALGAPEMLQPFLVDAPAGVALDAQACAWAERGLRVLLIAHHPDPALLEDRGDASLLPPGMTPLGLVGLSDELRADAGATLAAFGTAGVALKIISGDHPETVAALALQAGLGPEITRVSGPALEAMSPAAFDQAAEETTVFGRITPRQKEHLIAVLRARGHYVAMIGDGVNDVLALKKANLGIAPRSGSQATRAVADIVLVQDSFAALAPAVLEGQRIHNGMQHILKLFLARISTITLVIISALVVGIFPLAVRNSSVITLLTVGIPSVLLALWARPGVRPTSSLARDLWHFVVPAAAFSSLLGLAVFYSTIELRLWSLGLLGNAPEVTIEHAIAASVPYAQTALAAFLVFRGLLLVIFVEPPTAWWVGGAPLSGDRKPTALAVGLMVAYLVISAVPPLRTLFALSPLEPRYLPLVAMALVIWLLLAQSFWRGRFVERFLGVGDAERDAKR